MIYVVCAEYKWWVCAGGQQREQEMCGDRDERERKVRRGRVRVGVLYLL